MNIAARVKELWRDGLRDQAIANKIYDESGERLTRHKVRTFMGAEASSLRPGDLTRTVILSDIHCPFEDKALLAKIMLFLGNTWVDRLILNGDTLDFEGISRFVGVENVRLKEEVRQTKIILDDFARAVEANNPACEKHFTDGNHEDRLNKYLAANAEALVDLIDDNGELIVSVPHLLGLRNRGWMHRGYKEVLELPGNLFVEHGDRVSKHSGMTAKNLVLDKGGSIVIGHIHRTGFFSKTDRLGYHRGIEGGCLCQTDPKYMTQSSANWQQGFVVIDHAPDGTWWHQLVTVQNNQFVVDGQIW